MDNYVKRWCGFLGKRCDLNPNKETVCSDGKSDVVGCGHAKVLKGEFDVVITCKICGGNEVDMSAVYYNDDNYSEITYCCNKCGNEG